VIYNGFQGIDPNKVKLARTFGASRRQILTKVVLPGSVPTFIAALKVTAGLSLVGVVVGEFQRARDRRHADVLRHRLAGDFRDAPPLNAGLAQETDISSRRLSLKAAAPAWDALVSGYAAFPLNVTLKAGGDGN
jgi:hypothetical protein